MGPGPSTRRLKEFYDLTVPEETFLAFNETISLMDFVLRHPFAESQLSDDLQYRLKALAEAMKHDAYDSTTDVARLLLASKTTGDENDFVQLEGYYLVLRRGERGRFVVSALNIFYDDRKNICHWDNVNLGTQGKIEVNGIVSEVSGIFHFVGSVRNSAIIQAMNVPKPVQHWDMLSGIVLTQSNRYPLVSRCVLWKRNVEKITDLENLCGQKTKEDLEAMSFANWSLLDNTCSEDSILTPVEEF